MIRVIMAFLLSWTVCYLPAQKNSHYKLATLLGENGLITDSSNHVTVLKDSLYKEAISAQKIVWLKNVSFKNGTIEIDLRGKNVFLQSFLGIAFHASDSNHYEVVYFRPFNFQHADTARRKWSVQYMVVPEFLYDKLRTEHPLVYENSVTPVPDPDHWFHCTIVVANDSVTVYVNHSAIPSLQVKRLSAETAGMIGLWDDGLSGDFANLVIKS